jgi:hypothetical protein
VSQDRKPVLGWEEDEDGDFEVTVVGELFEESVYFSVTRFGDTWKCDDRSVSKENYETADEAKLACEDYLMTLLKPLAQTYKKLKENNNATR